MILGNALTSQASWQLWPGHTLALNGLVASMLDTSSAGVSTDFTRVDAQWMSLLGAGIYGSARLGAGVSHSSDRRFDSGEDFQKELHGEVRASVPIGPDLVTSLGSGYRAATSFRALAPGNTFYLSGTASYLLLDSVFLRGQADYFLTSYLDQTRNRLRAVADVGWYFRNFVLSANYQFLFEDQAGRPVAENILWLRMARGIDLGL